MCSEIAFGVFLLDQWMYFCIYMYVDAHPYMCMCDYQVSICIVGGCGLCQFMLV